MGDKLDFMTEKEFAKAEIQDSQAWTFRILCSIRKDVKDTKKEVEELKRNKFWWNKASSFAGGMVGGFVAFFIAPTKGS